MVSIVSLIDLSVVTCIMESVIGCYFARDSLSIVLIVLLLVLLDMDMDMDMVPLYPKIRVAKYVL